MKKIITYGTFDLLHVGHVRLLKRARALGDHLTVGLSTDEFNTIKHKDAFFDYETRKEMLLAVRYVDAVIPEKAWDQKSSDIQKLSIHTFVMGDDWKNEFDFLKGACEVRYLPRTKGVSTSHIKKNLNNRA